VDAHSWLGSATQEVPKTDEDIVTGAPSDGTPNKKKNSDTDNKTRTKKKENNKKNNHQQKTTRE